MISPLGSGLSAEPTLADCRSNKLYLAVDTLDYALAMEASPANEQDRDHVPPLMEKMQDETGRTVEVA